MKKLICWLRGHKWNDHEYSSTNEIVDYDDPFYGRLNGTFTWFSNLVCSNCGKRIWDLETARDAAYRKASKTC